MYIYAIFECFSLYGLHSFFCLNRFIYIFSYVHKKKSLNESAICFGCVTNSLFSLIASGQFCLLFCLLISFFSSNHVCFILFCFLKIIDHSILS